MVDFMLVDQRRAWPGYRRIGQAGIYVWHICISRLMSGYAGLSRIPTEMYRHILGYAGLMYLIYCAGAGMPDYLTCISHGSGI
jgi:hypothetical protein